MSQFANPRHSTPRPSFALHLILLVLFVAVCSLGGQTVRPAAAVPAPVSPTSQTPDAVLNGKAMLVGHFAPEQKLRLALAIQPPHMAAEEQFIRELTTKGSPNFHKFLTQDQWNARFAPSAEDEQAVVDWAQNQGLTVTHRYPNRLLVDVEGTSAAIEKAFGVTINNYQVAGEVDFSNDRDPVIPPQLAGILHAVVGLNSIERVHRIGSRTATVKGADYIAGPVVSEPGNSHGDGDVTKAPANRAAAENAGVSASSPTPRDSFPLDDKSGTYAADPDNIQSSEGYDFNALQRLSHCCNEPGDSGGSPAESSIALVGYGAFSTTDTSAFFNAYGMAWDINWYCIGGSPCPGVDGEAPLDVEYAGAMSNSYGSYLDTAHIFEYEMTNNLYTTYADTFNQIVSDDHAKVVSTSYGWEENVGFSGSEATGTMHPIFNNMVGTGWTLIAASGDNGASDGCGDATAVDYPASDPDFIAAGGTQLQLTDSGIFSSETSWQGEFWSGACGSNHGGSTGGVSVLFAAPSWQTSIESPYYEWVGNTEYIVTGNTNRLVPDISLTANPDVMGQWYYSGGSWQDEGGTSIVAPELAGFFAQENSYLDFVGNKCGSGSTACSPVGQASPFIYYDAIDGAPHNPFYDMTSGCNDNDDTSYWGLVYYCAGTGYDLVTGWGSANMLQLAWGINWELIPAYGQPSITFSGPATNTWYNTDQEISWSVTDAGSGGYPAPGVAGFTQGWDSIPSDPSSEPHGGEGNSFYSGPQYSFATTGCLSFNGSFGCSGGSGQGCHTAQVEGWDNQGRNATSTYGPVCFDNVAPNISISTNPATSYTTWSKKSVVVTLTASDPNGSNGSGIYRTYYAINTGSCYPGNLGACTVYSGPFTMSAQGQSYIYYFTEDKAGNFSTEPYQWVSIDTTPPTTSIGLSGSLVGGVWESAVTVTLTATDNLSGVAHTYYSLDGGAYVNYTGSFVVGTVGSHTVKFYAVDVAGNTEASQTTTFTIESPTAVALSANPSPASYGQAVSLKAVVTASVSGTPTGTVIFLRGGTTLGSASLSGGVATLSTSTLPVGSDSLSAVYAGATNYLGSSGTAVETIDAAPTTTTLVSSVNPALYGQSVTLTATVASTTTGTPHGTVTFKSGSTTLGTGTLSGGVATLATTALPIGHDSLTAVYGGGSSFLSSTSPALAEVVNPAPTTTTLATSVNPASYGQSVVLTATVAATTSGTPHGTVTFKNGATTLGTGTLSSGIATLTTASLPIGNDSLTAVYGGGSAYLTSTSSAVVEQVVAAATTTVLTPSANPTTYGASLTLTAVVTSSTTGTPGGTVTFKRGAATLGTGTLSAGTATFTTSTLTAGSDSLTAVYSGSADYLTSTSAAVAETVQAAPTTTVLTVSPNPATAGSTVTLTAVVTSSTSGTPASVVNFYNGTTKIGSATPSGGTATFTTTTLPVGSDSLTAVFSGGSAYQTSTSAAVVEVVNP